MNFLSISITRDIRIPLPMTSAPLVTAFLRDVRTANTFTNPAFTEALRMGRSTRDIDELLLTHHTRDGSLHLPRGYASSLISTAKRAGVHLNIDDRRVTAPVNFPPLAATLRDYQRQAMDDMGVRTQGVLVSPTGSGKSLMGMALIRMCGQRALILVHSKELMAQWVGTIRKFMGVEAGTIGDGRWNPGEMITVAMIQTLTRREQETVIFAQVVGLVLVDECHHIPASTFSKVIEMFPGRYRFGLSATPGRRDGLERMIYNFIGPVAAQVSADVVEQAGGTVPVQVVGVEGVQVEIDDDESWNSFQAKLVSDDDRHGLIAGLAEGWSGTGSAVLVLTDRVDHAERLVGFINMDGVALVHGGLSTKARREAMEQAKTAPVTVGTIGLLGEGLDLPRWNVLILATPISSETRLSQAIGRVMRPFPGKTAATVIDVADDHPFADSSCEKRLAIYRKRRLPVHWQRQQVRGGMAWA